MSDLRQTDPTPFILFGERRGVEVTETYTGAQDMHMSKSKVITYCSLVDRGAILHHGGEGGGVYSSHRARL